MRKLHVWTGAALLGGLLVTAAASQDAATPGEQPLLQDNEVRGELQTAPEEAVPGEVPQAQVDIVEKRDEARQRRDELLRMRAQAVEAGD